MRMLHDGVVSRTILLLAGTLFGVAQAQNLPLTTPASLEGQPRKLIESLIKERSAGAMPVLKIAELIKRSVVPVPSSEGFSEAVRTPLAIAVMEHPNWTSAGVGVEYAQASADESRSALRPQITGGLDYGVRSYGANPLSGSSSIDYNSTTSQIGVKQLLYDGGAKLNTWKSAQKKVEAQTARSFIQQSELMYSLLEAAMNKQRFEIQRLWVNNFEEQRKETARKITRKFELGSGTIYDIARSDLKVSDSRINLQQIELQMNNATSVLQEFNLPENLTLPTVADRVVLSELDMEDQLKEHPLLIEAQAFVDASALDLDAAKSNRSPIIQLELSRSDRLFSSIDKHNADYSGLITLTQNFYTGGSEGARLTQSNSRYIQARAELDSKKKGLRTALMRAGYDVNNLYSALELRKAGVDASMATFASTAKLFEVNRGTLIDLQQSEDDLYDKVKLLIDNWFDVSIAYYRYLHVNNMLTTRFLAPRSVVQGNIKPNS